MNNLRVIPISEMISTDDIIPAHYKHKFTNPKDLAPYVFENKYPELSKVLQYNDVIVSDKIFGVGSSREQAVSALIAAGVTAVLAPAFGRIFFRNAWNIGLIALEVELPKLPEFSLLEIDLLNGVVITDLGNFFFLPIPRELISIFEQGGILNYAKSLLSAYNVDSI